MRVMKMGFELSKAVNHLYKSTMTKEERDSFHKLRTETYERIIAEQGCPIDPGYVRSIDYDSKTDRYTVTFESNARKSKLRVTDDIAQFILTNQNIAGTWRIKMETGVVTDAVLLSPE